MVTNEFIQLLRNTAIIPVIKLNDISDATELANALYQGGIKAAEVTFRAAGAERVIADMTKAFPDMLIGAGTVLTTEQVDKAISAGAKFCVAPGLNPNVVSHCLEKGVPFVPGVANGSQIEQALELGLNFVKFFPAEQAGGLAYIKAISAPYSMMRFMPTGGINEDNINSYLAYDKIVCCGGSWIVPDNLVKTKKWSEITALCRQAVNKILGFELAHIGINCDSQQEALLGAQQFGDMFGLVPTTGNSSVFAGKSVELMNTPYKGERGHIAFACCDIERAIYQLESKGYQLDTSTAKYDNKGKLTVIYLSNHVSGFAIHLIEKK